MKCDHAAVVFFLNKLSSWYARGLCAPFIFSSSYFTWTFLMAYCKLKMKKKKKG
jgi:hypothetical protein